jgi:hypothetical protein
LGKNSATLQKAMEEKFRERLALTTAEYGEQVDTAFRVSNAIKSLLPAGRKFCKITQSRPKKESDWPAKFWTKAAENRTKKYFIKNMVF